MQSSRSRDTSNRNPAYSVRGVRVRGLMVWALMGVGLLAWDMSREGQAARQQGTWSAQEQGHPQPPNWQAPVRPVPPGQPGQAAVMVDGGKLSVSLREAGFREVMEAIARQAGMKVSFLGEVGQATLTASFVGLPLEDGLRRLLRGTDHAFVYTGTGAARRVSQVFVLSGSAAQPPTLAAETVGEPTVAVAAAIREAIDTQRFAEAVQAAIVAEGGTTQEEARQEGMGPDLNTALQRGLSGQDGTQLLTDQLQQAADRLRQLLEQREQ